jgi:hypothetical protein
MQERWLPVVGHEGDYEVSDRGRVRSLDRVVQRSSSPQRRRGQMIKRCLSHGYPVVNLAGQTRQIHVLMLEAFVGPRPSDMYGCHNDDVRTNNVLSNLRWGTPTSNSHDKRVHGNEFNASKQTCPRRHELERPNLVECMLRGGRRACLACNRAQGVNKGRVRSGRPTIDAHAYADRVYRNLMNGGPGTWASCAQSS